MKEQHDDNRELFEMLKSAYLSAEKLILEYEQDNGKVFDFLLNNEEEIRIQKYNVKARDMACMFRLTKLVVTQWYRGKNYVLCDETGNNYNDF